MTNHSARAAIKTRVMFGFFAFLPFSIPHDPPFLSCHNRHVIVQKSTLISKSQYGHSPSINQIAAPKNPKQKQRACALPPPCSFEYHGAHSSRCNGHTTEYCYSQQTFLGDLVINEASQTPCLQI